MTYVSDVMIQLTSSIPSSYSISPVASIVESILFCLRSGRSRERDPIEFQRAASKAEGVKED